MSNVPTAKQSLRSVIVKLFPFLGGFVAVVGAKGKGLAIRAASGLLHLAGGPDDPAVARVNDLGTSGTIAATANTITITDAVGNVLTLAFAYVAPNIVITAVPPSPPFKVVTKNETGSEKVTCG